MFKETEKTFLYDLILDNFRTDKKTQHLLYSAYNKIAGNFKDNSFTKEEAQAMVDLLHTQFCTGKYNDYIDMIDQLGTYFELLLEEVVA